MRRFRLIPAVLALFATVIACSGPVDKDGQAMTHGSFRLRTFPTGARVWINDELKVEQTPATLVLPQGRYELKIQHPGAEATRKTIKIKAGVRKDRTFNIPKPPPATISVFSDLVGASVRVNGYIRGRTPLTEAVTRPGPIDMTVIAPGGQAKSIKTHLDIAEREVIEVFFGDVQCEQNEEESQPQLMSRPPSAGWVSLAFRPTGDVFDESGKKLGSAPLLNHSMKVGLHKLRLRSEGGKYERWVKIEVEKNKKHVFRFRLRDEDKTSD